ncbi:uncharacterized protein LOC119590855 [Penaeus monodon]|uniref:uncharacterized protein LOC119590855 n=1 Tax=Penaeus monodon TaxID=6687 RepID=UPI0018A7482F|nr:uncharacterized protein LOC119590855 [Penaeus monodon]
MHCVDYPRGQHGRAEESFRFRLLIEASAMSGQPTQVVVATETLPPGTCTVCRRGKIKNKASCCTWITCLLLLPFGIIPGIIAFCCCCREPKCTHCGYTP